jgi:hypothetical protein
MHGGSLARKWALIAALGVAIARPTPARADDHIAELTAMLSSTSQKTRLSAVVSLARLGDKRTLRPLVSALHDPDPDVRAIAATALGHLGHRAALPALRNASHDDTDARVRAHAHHAAILVARANGLPDELDPPRTAKAAHHGFGHSPHAVVDRPDLYVTIKSSSDDSPGSADKRTRKADAEIVRATLNDALRTAPQVTMAAQVAERWGLEARHIDLSVVQLSVTPRGGIVEVEAQLRLAITDDTGKMLSFLSGGAKVQVPRAKFNPAYLPTMRREALEGAMRGMVDTLLAHLRDTEQS